MMAFLHADSCECVTTNLDLFSVPPTQTSVEHGVYVDYHPLTNVTDGSPIEFDLPASVTDYLDLANVKVKVTQRDGTNLQPDAQVAPVNLFLHSLFSQVDIRPMLNGTSVTAANDTYPYRAYMETLLSYGEDAKNSQLTSALYYKDEAGRFDHITIAGDATNEGYVSRNKLIRGSRSVDMIGRIHADLFFQGRYLLNEVNVKIKLVRSRDTFWLMGANQYKTSTESAILYVRKVKLSSSVFLAHAKALENGTAKYPVRRVTCKTVTIPAGYFDISHELHHLWWGDSATLRAGPTRAISRHATSLYLPTEMMNY